MNNINFSIIIPHYNIPELLDRCLKSIPIRPDIQVIVVDDCSPNADTFVEKFATLKHPYLEWYSTPKGGSAGRARNIGLKHAKGKWVICIDADDLFVDNVEEILEDSINREEDILFYNYLSVYSDDLKKEADRTNFQSFFQQYTKDHDELPFRYYFETIWGKVIKREMIETYNIRCEETKYSNDAGFSIKIGYYAKRIAIIDKPFFIITKRRKSLASSFYEKQFQLEECKIRTYASVIIQNFVDKKGVGIELKTFQFFKKVLLENYPSAFFILLLKSIIKYPYCSKRLFEFWLKHKFLTVKFILNKLIKCR